MALINCPECAKEMSDQAKNCPNCGYQPKSKPIKIPKKALRVSIFVIIAVILSIGSFLFYNNYYIAPSEKIGLDNIKHLKSTLKDPDSLKLYEDVIILSYTDAQGENNLYTYIKYGAKNSYGAMGKAFAVYKGNEYIGDLYDLDEEDYSTDIYENLNNLSYRLELSLAQIPYYLYTKDLELNNEDTEMGIKKSVIVRKEKIMIRLKY